MTSWRVRPPVESDYLRWRELYQGYADFYRTPQPDSAARRVWGWINDPGHEVNALLVEDEGGQVAGLAHYRPFARPLAASVGCYLDDLYVDAGRRGGGAADALLVELGRLAEERGWTVVRWITASDNQRAMAVYERHATRTDWVTWDLAP